MHSREYQQVIRSQAWSDRRKRMIATAGGCERCYLITKDLELHHKHYETLGRESDEDLEVLCKACHREADSQRQCEVLRNQYYRQVTGWARKKYGEDWESLIDFSDVAEEFDRWIENRDY